MKRGIQELAKAAGYSVESVICLKQIVKSGYGVGVGKAQELAEIVSGNDSDTLIIDEIVTSSQANNLAKVTHVEVIDRERLILSIFALRAATTQAKLRSSSPSCATNCLGQRMSCATRPRAREPGSWELGSLPWTSSSRP